MIRVLCEASEIATGDAIVAYLREGLAASAVEIQLTGSAWSGDPEWDDALVVLFRDNVANDAFVQSIDSYKNLHRVPDPQSGQSVPGGFILPVALDPAATKPPPPIDLIKSLTWDGTAAVASRLLERLKVLLGLALMRGHSIFISYKQPTGAMLAQDLYDRLLGAGFAPWLDAAPHSLPVGANVQATIHRHIESAALLILVDTEDVAQSDWIGEEIDAAYAQFVPILPVIPGGRNTSSFISVKSNERRALVQAGQPTAGPLSDQDWDVVLHEVEALLLSCYQRRMRIIAHAEKEFTAQGYQWQVLDPRRRMYFARLEGQPPMQVLSHCLIHEPTDIAALKAYEQYLVDRSKATPMPVTPLCVYDRNSILSKYERKNVHQFLVLYPYTLAHVNQLHTIISNNFNPRFLT